ncbi:MAG TPA: GNAT family N-acetyltransferase [Chlamydiales bacterium]|nr:GNAT family N-acetyltransferase [Chlamydiales bacterium]
MEFQVVTGNLFKQYINTVANLRMSIFKEYPYLYDGSMTYEAEYLKSYAVSKNSILIIVKDKEKIVGAITGIPLMETDEMFRIPFVKHHFPVRSIFYLGEILLLKEYRGKGIGYKMYKMFEDLVRKNKQYEKIAIAEVLRDKNDPRKPENYVSVHKLWERLGYIEHSEMIMQAPYKEIGGAGKVPHSLIFSFKDLS